MKRTTKVKKKREEKIVIYRNRKPKTENITGVILRTTIPKNRKEGGIVVITEENPLGGHLPNPPKDCDKKKYFKEFKGVVWIDLSICHGCTQKPVCKGRKIYLAKLKKDRNEKLEALKLKEKTKGKEKTK